MKYISGMSGIELARVVLEKCGMQVSSETDLPHIDYPPEYWIGWILAYYQWYTGKSFDAICKRISYEDMNKLYGVLHEAEPSKAVEVFDSLMLKDSETSLTKLRKNCGLSQAQLAKVADVSLRFIQMYEQRQDDINKCTV